MYEASYTLSVGNESSKKGKKLEGEKTYMYNDWIPLEAN